MHAAAQGAKELCAAQEEVAKRRQRVQGAWHTGAGPGAADEAGTKGKQAEGREHELLEGEGYTGRGRLCEWNERGGMRQQRSCASGGLATGSKQGASVRPKMVCAACYAGAAAFSIVASKSLSWRDKLTLSPCCVCLLVASSGVHKPRTRTRGGKLKAGALGRPDDEASGKAPSGEAEAGTGAFAEDQEVQQDEDEEPFSGADTVEDLLADY